MCVAGGQSRPRYSAKAIESAAGNIGYIAGEAPLYLTVDGQVGVELQPNDVVMLSAAAQRLRLVRPQEKTYFCVLRDKLKWGER